MKMYRRSLLFVVISVGMLMNACFALQAAPSATPTHTPKPIYTLVGGAKCTPGDVYVEQVYYNFDGTISVTKYVCVPPGAHMTEPYDTDSAYGAVADCLPGDNKIEGFAKNGNPISYCVPPGVSIPPYFTSTATATNTPTSTPTNTPTATATPTPFPPTPVVLFTWWCFDLGKQEGALAIRDLIFGPIILFDSGTLYGIIPPDPAGNTVFIGPQGAPFTAKECNSNTCTTIPLHYGSCAPNQPNGGGGGAEPTPGRGP